MSYTSLELFDAIGHCECPINESNILWYGLGITTGVVINLYLNMCKGLFFPERYPKETTDTEEEDEVYIQTDISDTEDPQDVEVTEFKCGDKVVILLKEDQEEPRYGWGGVKLGDVGVIIRKGEENKYYINFPEHENWMGIEEELKLAE